MTKETIYIASDHAGVSYKKQLVDVLSKDFPERVFKDLGPQTEASVDYPDFARLVAENVVESKTKGILICGSGLGMCISANKFPGVRAVSAWDTTTARLSRQHNDANIICLGARLTGPEVGLDAVRMFLKTGFEGGRHQKRLDKITEIEKAP